MKHIALFFLCWIHLFADTLVWSPPEVLSTLGIDASNPQIGMDNSGNLVAVWIENGVVIANTQPLNGSWGSSSVQVSSSGASSLELVVDPAGNATAIWNQNGIIESASLPFNGTWSSSVALSTAGSSSPQIAVDSSGNVAAIWVCNGVIQSSIQLFNGAWPSTPANLSAASTSSDSPQIAIGGNQTIVAVWHSTSMGTDAIFSSQTTLTGSWSSAAIISNTANASAYPQVAVDLKGNSIAAWYRYTLANANYSGVIVQTSFLPADGSWSTPTDLSTAGIRNPSGLVLKVKYNPFGRAMALWNNSPDGESFDVVGTVYGRLGWISSLSFVSRNFYAFDLDFSDGLAGYVFAAYMLYDPLTASIAIQTCSVNTYSSSVNIGDMQIISSGGSNGYPRIVGNFIGSTKYTGAVWLSFNGSNNVVQSATASASVISPPTNLTVVQSSNDFGIFTEYYNTLSWQGSSTSSVSGFVLFRNGTMIGSGPPDVFQYIDHNAEQNQPVVYGVAFLESNGNQSATTTVHFP